MHQKIVHFYFDLVIPENNVGSHIKIIRSVNMKDEYRQYRRTEIVVNLIHLFVVLL